MNKDRKTTNIPIDQVESFHYDKESAELRITTLEPSNMPLNFELQRAAFRANWKTYVSAINREKAQIWQNEFGANTQTEAGRSVEDMSHEFAEIDADNRFQAAVTTIPEHFPGELFVESLFGESRDMESNSGIRGWAEQYTIHILGRVIAPARGYSDERVQELRDFLVALSTSGKR